MDAALSVFEVERQGGTLVLTPLRDLRELDFQGMQAERDEVLLWLEEGPIRNVVVDLGRTDYFNSTFLGVLVRLWQRAQSHAGHMALCNLSAHEQDMLGVTGLIELWPVFASREEALHAVVGGGLDLVVHGRRPVGARPELWEGSGEGNAMTELENEG